MTPAQYQRVNDLFLAASRLPESKRAEYLDAECGGDAALRNEIDKLLANDGATQTDFLEPAVRIAVRPSLDNTPDAIPDYEIIRSLGKGGFGEVWLARNIHDHQYYAVKVLFEHVAVELDGVREYKERARQDPNFVPIEHVGCANGLYYYVMPLADDAKGASTLRDPQRYEPMTLDRYLKWKGHLPVDEVASIADGLLAALGTLHSTGATHRDVKPANVLRVGGRWRLADVGLMSSIERVAGDRGTIAYWPPEKPRDRTADLYALGKSMFELATGESVVRFPALVEGTLRIPGDEPRNEVLRRIMLKACDDDPAERYRTAGEMRAALGTLRPASAIGRRRVLAVVGVAVVVVAVLLGGFAMFSREHRDLPAGAVPVAEPVTIKSFEVRRHIGGNPRHDSIIGAPTLYVNLDDSGSVELELSRAAYAYVVAFHPNGKTQLLYPGSEDSVPEKRSILSAPVYPDGNAAIVRFSEDTGLEAIAAIISAEPLPAFSEWRTGTRGLPWRPADGSAVWEYADWSFRQLGATRGDLLPAEKRPDSFAELVKHIERVDGVEALRAIAFPVRPAGALDTN